MNVEEGGAFGKTQQNFKTKAILSSPMHIKTRGGAFLPHVHICGLCGCDECKLDPPSSHSFCKLDFKTLDAGTVADSVMYSQRLD